MEKYWNVKIELKHENDNGKVSKTNEVYLVLAYTPTDAEAKIAKKAEGWDYTVKSVSQTKILEVL